MSQDGFLFKHTIKALIAFQQFCALLFPRQCNMDPAACIGSQLEQEVSNTQNTHLEQFRTPIDLLINSSCPLSEHFDAL
jgi:hypothetical protein